MSILSKLFGRSESRSVDFLPPAFGGYGGSYNDSGVSVSESNALAASSVFACVKILAEAVAQLPIHIMQRAEGGKQSQHPLASLLAAEPNEFMTAATFHEALMLNFCLYGNAYAFIEKDAQGRPIGLYPLRSDSTRPVRQNGELFYTTRLGDNVITLPTDSVFHILSFSFDGILGVSPIQQAKQNIGLGIALERFAAKLFSNGGNVGGILKLPKMNDDAMKNFVSSWKAANVGLDNSFKVAVLTDGMDFVKTTIDAEEGQVKDARIHQVLEVARIYRIPPHMLGVLDKASYASLEVSNQEFYEQAVQPIIRKIEQEANRKLLLELEKPVIEVRFNMDAMLRASTKERFDVYASAVNNGLMTRAECRAKEGLPFIAGSDVLLMPLNMAPIEQSGNKPALTPPANTPPAPADDKEATRNLLMAIVKRFVTKEAKAIQRAASKRNTDELRGWATTFYTDHRQLVADALDPVLKFTKLKANAEAVAQRHCDAGLRLIESANKQGLTAEELLQDVEARSVDLVDDLLKDLPHEDAA